MDIEYSERNIRLFEKFLKPVTISDLDNYEKYFYNYKDDIKGFLEKECNIYISIWYNETHRGKIWFYLVECRNEYYTSDEQYQNDLLTYNMALNRAVEFIFTKILNCG